MVQIFGNILLGILHLTQGTFCLSIGMLFSDGESEGGEDDTSDSDFEPEKEGGNVSVSVLSYCV